MVTLEQPELEERHHDLVTSIATDQKQLLDIEDQILSLLNEAGSGVEVLDDEVRHVRENPALTAVEPTHVNQSLSISPTRQVVVGMSLSYDRPPLCLFGAFFYADPHHHAQQIESNEQGDWRAPRGQQKHKATDRGESRTLQAGGSPRFPAVFHRRRALQGRRHVPVQPGLFPGTVYLAMQCPPLAFPVGYDWQVVSRCLIKFTERFLRPLGGSWKQQFSSTTAKHSCMPAYSFRPTWPKYAQDLPTQTPRSRKSSAHAALTAAVVHKLYRGYAGRWTWGTAGKAPATSREEHRGRISRGFEGVV